MGSTNTSTTKSTMCPCYRRRSFRLITAPTIATSLSLELLLRLLSELRKPLYTIVCLPPITPLCRLPWCNPLLRLTTWTTWTTMMTLKIPYFCGLAIIIFCGQLIKDRLARGSILLVPSVRFLHPLFIGCFCLTVGLPPSFRRPRSYLKIIHGDVAGNTTVS